MCEPERVNNATRAAIPNQLQMKRRVGGCSGCDAYLRQLVEQRERFESRSCDRKLKQNLREDAAIARML